MYFKGQGTTQDNVRAHMWGNIAGENGSEKGAELRDDTEELMTQSQIAEAQKLAREWMANHPSVRRQNIVDQGQSD
jgi:hypothetical protein